MPDLTGFDGNLPDDLTSGRYVIGMVADNGRGIPPEDQLELFTRFFRGGAAGTNIPGTGLGLSLVRELLQLYGGDITLSTKLGVGTAFCFWLLAHRNKGENS
jgi:signal transduction histidine kinase